MYTFNFLALLFSCFFGALKKCGCVLYGEEGGIRKCMVCTHMKMLTFMDSSLGKNLTFINAFCLTIVNINYMHRLVVSSSS